MKTSCGSGIRPSGCLNQDLQDVRMRRMKSRNMFKMLPLYLVAYLTLTSTIASAQVYQSGLILPDFSQVEESDVCCVYAPPDGFTVFDAPSGSAIGKLTRVGDSSHDDQAPYKLFFQQTSTRTQQQISYTNLEQIGYEVWAIPYVERKKGFVRILGKSSDIWISEAEIKRKSFRLSDWQSFLLSGAGDVLGYYANAPGLNLRKTPSSNAVLLKTLKGDLFEISPTGQMQGAWAKVKVKKYKEHPCVSDLEQDELTEYELEGWIKIVTDEGLPNVWFYARGC